MDDTEMPGPRPRQDQLLEEASLWFSRMRGPDAEAFRAGFERWLALGAAHLGAYNRAGEIFALGKFLTETPDAQTIDARNRPDPAIGWRTIAAAACLLLAVGLTGWLGRDLISAQFGAGTQVAGKASTEPAAVERLTADRGTTRKLVLADGSTIRLAPGSVLETRFDANRRELKLESGRAWFEVAHEARPFVVLAGGGSVTARGTVFEVILGRDHGVTVHLLRGAVDVERPMASAAVDGAKPNVTRLAPGETLSFGTPSPPLLASTTQPDMHRMAVTSPVASQAIEFDKTPLSQIVAQANQGSALSIRLADPAIGDLKVSGRFRIGDPERVAEHLASLFNLKAERIGNDEILLQAR
jgi:transmembrane sensor